jgi:GR25 family glycosyltransferase involved in LPS biosynthesis
MGGDSVPAFDVANSMSVRAELGLKLRERTDDVGIAGGIAARAVAPAVCRTRTVKPGDGPWWVGPEGSDAAGWGESPENSAVMQTERRSYHRAYHRGGRLIERLAGAGRKATVSNPATFCISLKDSPRRGAFAALASTHSVAFEFIDAMSTDDVRRGATIGDCRIDITDLRWTHFDRFETRRRHAPLMYSEIGCAYSHMMCWRLAKDRDLDHVCIFEDDAVLCRGLRDIEIPRGADMVYLSNRMPRDCFGKARTPGSGTEGYILTRAGILKCLEIFKVLYMPIDLQLMAHQVSSVKSGFWIAGYRRDLPDDGLLKAYVARRPYCHHPDGGDSEIEPADSRSAAAERDMLRRQLAAMRSSTSWRLTAPIRALKTMFGMWAPGESVSVSARE